MKIAKYEFRQSVDKQWRWHLKAPNGEILSSGEGYVTRAGCVRGIGAHRRHASTLRELQITRS